MVYKSFNDEKEMNRQCIADIKDLHLSKPILVFSDKTPAETIKFLSINFPKVKIEEILTLTQAEHARKFHKSRIQGIYFIDT